MLPATLNFRPAEAHSKRAEEGWGWRADEVNWKEASARNKAKRKTGKKLLPTFRRHINLNRTRLSHLIFRIIFIFIFRNEKLIVLCERCEYKNKYEKAHHKHSKWMARMGEGTSKSKTETETKANKAINDKRAAGKRQTQTTEMEIENLWKCRWLNRTKNKAATRRMSNVRLCVRACVCVGKLLPCFLMRYAHTHTHTRNIAYNRSSSTYICLHDYVKMC